MRSVLKRFSPFNWPNHVVQTISIAFFAIMLPVYIFIGLQPATATDFTNYPHLTIGSISLDTPVEALALTEQGQLVSPDRIAGSFSNAKNKTLLIGHSSTVFQNLHHIDPSGQIIFNNETYSIVNIETLLKENIKMSEILAPTDQPTIVIMTCAGESLGQNDFTHRLIITAVKVW